ncbi:MAG: acyl carrier protein [Gemmatimonadaceae bacterium]
MSADQDVREMVRGYILREFLPGVPASELTDSTPLISGGILDSLATVKLVAALEDRYKIEIQAHEASITHFNSVTDIASLVESKRK